MTLYFVIFASGIAAHVTFTRFVAALRRRAIDRLDNTSRDERAFSA